MPIGPPPPGSGYACSKWVSEMLVRRAAEQGMPTNIFRVGRAAWSSRTGIWNPNDFMQRLLSGCMQIGAAPELDLTVRLIPVDFAAEVILALAKREQIGETFHLVGQTSFSWNDLVMALQRHDGKLIRLSYREWWQRLIALHAGGVETVLSTLTEQLDPSAQSFDSDGLLTFDATHTNDTLGKCGLAEPLLSIDAFYMASGAVDASE